VDTRLLHTAPIPGEARELGLYQRGPDYFMKIVGGQDLMNSRAHASEDALGAIACRGLRGTPGARVLIGGLGMGFTLATALAALEADAEVVVAELVPGVVDWNRGVLGSCAGRPLDDPRAEVRVVDIADMLRDEREGFDATALDVDNGPDGLTLAANRWLYSAEGLAVLFGALRPGGVAAIWSAGPDKPFTKRLRGAGFVVEEVPVRAHAGKGSRHLIWVARKG
jgi:spermidine synthase